ncbi:MAG: hypothetical protein ACFFKA_15780, partial [Candidatus Thorarchaeota archaeon]
MENLLLTQFTNVISLQWPFTEFEEKYSPLSAREMFELTYHSCNSIGMRSVMIKLSLGETTGGSQAIFYSNTKKFVTIETFDNSLRVRKYFTEGSSGNKLITDIHPKLKRRKELFPNKNADVKIDLLKTILVERKIDECANYVMLKDINRKVYFTIGDARESAAVVP